MQLAKNNNAMWRVISNRDQPLPQLWRHPDLNKYQESQFETKKASALPEKLSDLKRPRPEKLVKSRHAGKRRRNGCHFPGLYVYVKRHFSNEAVLIVPFLIVALQFNPLWLILKNLGHISPDKMQLLPSAHFHISLSWPSPCVHKASLRFLCTFTS